MRLTQREREREREREKERERVPVALLIVLMFLIRCVSLLVCQWSSVFSSGCHGWGCNT